MQGKYVVYEAGDRFVTISSDGEPHIWEVDGNGRLDEVL